MKTFDLEKLLEVGFAIIFATKTSIVTRAERSLAEITVEAFALVKHQTIHNEFLHRVDRLSTSHTFCSSTKVRHHKTKKLLEERINDKRMLFS
jgi:hypothetical protein